MDRADLHRLDSYQNETYGRPATWNTCPLCGAHWADTRPSDPAHRSMLCAPCRRGELVMVKSS